MSNAPPLLQPPPQDLENKAAVRQWMLNTVSYISYLTRTSTSSLVVTSTASGSVTVKSYNLAGTLLSTQTITGI